MKLLNCRWLRLSAQIKLAMRLTMILLTAAFLQVSAKGTAQTITFSGRNIPITTAFEAVEKQAPFVFFYRTDDLSKCEPLTIALRNASLESALKQIFDKQPLSYTIEGNTIVVTRKAGLSTNSNESKSAIDQKLGNNLIHVKGMVTDPSGYPLVNVNVSVKGSNIKGTKTGAGGQFEIDVNDGEHIILSSVGYLGMTIQLNKGDKELPSAIISESERQPVGFANDGGENNNNEQAVGSLSIDNRSASALSLRIIIPLKNQTLDEAIVIGYGKTTRRFSTGNVSKITKEEIGTQPVSNPLSALIGRVPGLFITQSTGLPGSNFNVLIRGQNSLKQGNQPLYVVDGTPFMLNSGSLSQVSIMDINNPLNSINPGDIESIEVLKDADAISIYGSQGANGVILITTRKATKQKTELNLNYYTAFSTTAYKQHLLNTSDYLSMRKEAFRNDGIAPDLSSAPDLLLWDSTAYKDWQKVLTGGVAVSQNAQVSLNGGNEYTQFSLSGNYLRETTVFPQQKPASRGSSRLSVSHLSKNKRLRLNFGTAFTKDIRKLPFTDLTSYIYLPPNTPSARDLAGNISWVNWPNSIDNPFAKEYNTYRSETFNFLATASVDILVLKDVHFKINGGYNTLRLEENSTNPIKAQRPAVGVTGSAKYGVNTVEGWVLEPQLEYSKKVGKGNVSVMSGASCQRRIQQGTITSGTGFTNDDLINNLSSAPQITASNSYSQYRYLAFFSRIHYALRNRYIVNLNARRDGSSRFGPSNRFANFGAVGAGWIFTEEKSFRKLQRWLNYGKLRGSFGVSGNDQIGDYQYLDAWSGNSNYTYQGISGVLPSRLFNRYFQWERNRKLEAAIDLGFFGNKLLVGLSWYRNRSDNQLINYKIPATTGFVTILKNLDARIQNSGWELTIQSAILDKKNLVWNSSINLTIPQNKLLQYPNLEFSSDRYNYILGKPLTTLQTLSYQGIDPGTGIYTFLDVNNDGVISSPNDLITSAFVGQKFYGGVFNSLKIHQWELSFHIQFVKQVGRSFPATFSTVPGHLGNQPDFVLNRWNHSMGNSVQAFTSSWTNSATAYYNYQISDASISDASFARLRNVSLSYNLKPSFLRRWSIDQCRFYINAQNLLTISGYTAADPESQNIISLPPLRTIAAGIQLNFK